MKQGGMDIAAFRSELGLSLEAFAAQVGIASKGRMSVIERENRCSLGLALKIEEISGGRVDAATLSEDVKAARAGRSHDLFDNSAGPPRSSGKISSASPSQQGAVA